MQSTQFVIECGIKSSGICKRMQRSLNYELTRSECKGRRENEQFCTAVRILGLAVVGVGGLILKYISLHVLQRHLMRQRGPLGRCKCANVLENMIKYNDM
jgi:hypothetical protein